ncbi:MAG: methylated-DNA--[protein]-cysteine S-methyltransferase [Verrucomicrobiia bacterium]|jgi:AraC family transcriptional regulator of adaptative response/methylated-DNA-[protein]-cysteine methyltransferase
MEATLPETAIHSAAGPFSQAAVDYARIERALRFLNAHYLRRPTLDEIAAHIHLSPFHFERLFRRWAGTSPKRFLQYLTKEHAKTLLQDSGSLLDAAYESGLSGTGRLHDLFVSCEAVTPGEYKRRGEGVTIEYGFHPTPFGECLLARTERGICALRFPPTPSRQTALRELRDDWPAARFVKDDDKTGEICRRIFGGAAEDPRTPFHLHLRGTNFQLKVWQALLTIPSGKLVNYGGLAAKIGAPKASRAVGSAVGRNPIAWLIPCHRVIRSLGVIGDYHWGRERKQAMIAREAACFAGG